MKIKTNISVFILISITLACVSCGTNTMKDNDGKKYKTVRIGDQVWMAENLNYATNSGSRCYDEDQENCKKYGRLYDWKTANTVCPEGWHLPSKSDFDKLLSNVGDNESSRIKRLKKGGSSGFNALFGGWAFYYVDFYVISNDSTVKASYNLDFYDIETNLKMWSSTKYEDQNAYCLSLQINQYASVGSCNQEMIGVLYVASETKKFYLTN